MKDAKNRLRRSLLSVAAGLTYHSGLLRGLRSAANRWESPVPPNGAMRIPQLRRRKGGNVQVLVYHRVTPKADEYLPSLSVEAFSRQMRYLAQNCRVLPLTEAVRTIECGSVPDNAVALTFDDGYRDNFDHAFPILRDLHLPATIFLSTSVIGTDDILWHDRVFRAFNRTRAARHRGFDLSSNDEKNAAQAAVLTTLKKLETTERLERIAELIEELEVVEPEQNHRVMLDWGEVRQMARSGITFGSHTVTHPVLSRIPIELARYEITESKRVIETELQCEIDTFAYPNGRSEDYTESTKQALKDAGFTCAVTTRFGTNNAHAKPAWDPFELRRGGPDDASTALFAAKLSLYKMTT